MRLQRARLWAVAHVREGSALRVVAGRIVDDRLPAGVRIDVLRIDSQRLVRMWFGAVERLAIVPELEARRAALPRAARPCITFAPAKKLAQLCAACGHPASAHAEARALRILGRPARYVRFRWQESMLIEIEVARKLGELQLKAPRRPVLLLGGFDFCPPEAWRRLAAAGVPVAAPYERVRRAYEERLLTTICDQRTRVTSSIADALGLDPGDVDVQWEPRLGLADQLEARVHAVFVGGARIDDETWRRLADVGVPLARQGFCTPGAGSACSGH